MYRERIPQWVYQVCLARVQPTSHHCWQRKVIVYLLMILIPVVKDL